MHKDNPILHSLGHAALVVLYVTVITRVMANAEHIFGRMQTFWGPIAFLLLFVCSATITGVLVLGRPVILYLNNQKREAIAFLFMTIGWLALVIIVIFAAAVHGA